jgi:monothiol glutaredoxin
LHSDDGWRRQRGELSTAKRLPEGPDADRGRLPGVATLDYFLRGPMKAVEQHTQVPDVDVNSRIEEQLKSHDILLYMKGTPDFPQCGFSGQTVAALNAIGKPFSFVNIFEDQEVREGLKTYSNWPTFPQLYVKGEFIGGCDIVIEMYQSGELKDLLDS